MLQIGEALLDVAVALAQRVVFGVRDGRLVVLVVALVVLAQFGMQPRVLGLGLLFGQVGNSDFGCVTRGHHSVIPGRAEGASPESINHNTIE